MRDGNEAATDAYQRFVQVAYPGDDATQAAALESQRKPDQPECELAGHAAFRQYCSNKFDVNSAFALQYHRAVVHVCADIATGLDLEISSAIEMACSDEVVV